MVKNCNQQWWERFKSHRSVAYVAYKCENFLVYRFAFLDQFRGLGATYDDYLTFTGKRVVEFLLVLIEFFSLDITAEALPANIGLKSTIPL